MQVHRDIEHLPAFNNAVITIGTFDGVHTGHQKIISQLKKEAQAIHGETVIITFHPHPRMVVHEGQSPVAVLTTLAEKTALLKAQGINHLVVVPFNEGFARQTAEEYITDFLVAKFKPHTIIIGYDHRFGKGRTGDYHLLEAYGEKLGFLVKEIPAQVLNDITVSSTRIREALLRGDVDTANECLGYEYHFEGTVVDGNKLGRTLGYPTANLRIEDADKLVPGNGIYAVRVSIAHSPLSIDETPKKEGMSNKSAIGHGQWTMDNGLGMMSIGVRPTIGVSERTIEVNIFDFNEDIYGQTLRVYMAKYLRAELKFNGLAELIAALAKDKEDAITFFAEQGWGPYQKGDTIDTAGSEAGTTVLDFEHVRGARITLERDAAHAPFAITFGIYGLMFHTHWVGTLSEAGQYIRQTKYTINEVMGLYNTPEDERGKRWGERHNALMDALVS